MIFSSTEPLDTNSNTWQDIVFLIFNSHGIDTAILDYSGFSTGINYLFVVYFVPGYNLTNADYCLETQPSSEVSTKIHLL